MIDSHHHLWHYAKEEYPWIPEGSPHAPVFHRRELTLLASRNALPSDFPAIINLIRAGKINTDVWITHRISFDEVPEKFAQFTDPNLGAIKAIIEVI